MDFNNSGIGYCLEYRTDEALSTAKHHPAKSHLYQTCYMYTDIVQNQLL